ncbi:hypothetical protein FACS189452_01270 [Bacteroidia bacterium]|nr:hypothetical protein FACS189452_01270 [Bacteroidia bacterium]
MAEFGADGIMQTPIGEVKMGENQYAKMVTKKRTVEFGMIRPTLTNPDIVIEEQSVAKEGCMERLSSYLFIKTFNCNNNKLHHFESVTVSKDGNEVVVSNHIVNEKQLIKKLMRGKVMYKKGVLNPFNSDSHLVENHRDGLPDLLPSQELSTP